MFPLKHSEDRRRTAYSRIDGKKHLAKSPIRTIVRVADRDRFSEPRDPRIFRTPSPRGQLSIFSRQLPTTEFRPKSLCWRTFSDFFTRDELPWQGASRSSGAEAVATFGREDWKICGSSRGWFWRPVLRGWPHVGTRRLSKRFMVREPAQRPRSSWTATLLPAPSSDRRVTFYTARQTRAGVTESTRGTDRAFSRLSSTALSDASQSVFERGSRPHDSFAESKAAGFDLQTCIRRTVSPRAKPDAASRSMTDAVFSFIRDDLRVTLHLQQEVQHVQENPDREPG
jgi:hypothetical protein